MKKTFRRATFKANVGYYELFPFFSRDFEGLKFRHYVLEYVAFGRCQSRMQFHPWETRFNLFSLLKRARKSCVGAKDNHVKN